MSNIEIQFELASEIYKNRKRRTDGNNGEVQGNTNENITYFTFIKLGDT